MDAASPSTETEPHAETESTADLTVLSVTDKALRRVLEIRSGEEDPTALALWVEIMGASGDEFAYDIYFQSADQAGEGDVHSRHGEDGELVVIVPSDSVDQLRGATLDLSRDLLSPGLVMNNPNQPPAPSSPGVPAGPPLELSGTPAERITQVLEAQVNPSIASHGGRADLVAFEDGTAYLRLSGGCQGCAQSTATLRQGIEGTLRSAVPEITAVVDVTDHASGENPYFETAAH